MLSDLFFFFQNGNFVFLALFLAIFPLNWLLESYKWKYIIKQIETISLKRAVVGVIAGITLSTFTPNRIGEFAGRTLVLKIQNRFKGSILTVISSMAQLMVTLILGVPAALYFIYIQNYLEANLLVLFGVICILLIAVSLFSFYNPEFVLKLFPIRFRRKKWYRNFLVLRMLSLQIQSVLLVYSLLRYFVFTFQWIFLIFFLKIDADFLALLYLIPAAFLGQTLVPTHFFSEIGVRGSFALFFIGAAVMGHAEIAILLSSFLLWLVNLVFPGIFGLLLIFKLNLFRDNNLD